MIQHVYLDDAPKFLVDKISIPEVNPVIEKAP